MSVRLLVGNSRLKRLFVLKTLSRTQRARKDKSCGNLPETTAFKGYAAKKERKSPYYANYSDLPAISILRLTHSEASEGYPTIVNNIQPCQKLCLLMPLARVGARADSTTRLQVQCEARPISGTCIGVVCKKDAVFATRVLHFGASYIDALLMLQYNHR